MNNILQQAKEARSDLKALRAYIDDTEPTLRSMQSGFFSTKLAKWVSTQYLRHESDLSPDKWTELLNVAIDLLTFFLSNFIAENGQIKGKKWFNIPFWVKVGKTAFEAVRRIISIFSK